MLRMYTPQRTNTENSTQTFPEKEFPHSCVCERFTSIYSHDRSGCSAAGNMWVDRSWEYINRSQTHECGNWDWGRAIPRKGIHKWDFLLQCMLQTDYKSTLWCLFCGKLLSQQLFLVLSIDFLPKGRPSWLLPFYLRTFYCIHLYTAKNLMSGDKRLHEMKLIKCSMKICA
jgi:hypothetical protein